MIPIWYVLIWSPEGRPIAKTRARSAQDAKKRTPMPFKKYKGEVYAQPLVEYEKTIGTLNGGIPIV